MINTLARFLMGAWVGAIAVSVFVAIRAFQRMSDAAAGDLVAPVFYWVDLCGIVIGVLFAVYARASKWRFVLALLMSAGAAANLLLVGPKIAAGGEGFETAHTAAEIIWGVLFVCGVLLSLSPKPTHGGG
ncbi:MAG: DUF4149 domain-containing protein [Planctomycetota bacterium]|jgi:hypothetical protein